ncbi:hypothetical protein Tco_1349632 [Tanacetum coccineum]
MLGENVTSVVTKEPPSHTEGEIDDMETKEPEDNPVIDITPLEQTSRTQKYKRHLLLVTTTSNLLQRSLSCNKRIAPGSCDAPIFVPYEINGKNFHHTEEQIQAYIDKEEQIKKAAKEAKMFEITKTEVIKVVQEEAEKIGLDPKKIISAKVGKNTQLDELGLIIEKKKNSIIKDLMTSLGKRYERLKKIPKELRIQSALPALEQAPSQSLKRKRKHMELEPEIKVP